MEGPIYVLFWLKRSIYLMSSHIHGLPRGPFSTPNKDLPNKDEDKTIEIKPAEC